MIGQRFNHLVVIRDSGIRKYRAVYWECLCDCGKTTVVRSSNLRDGSIKSCGCLLRVKGTPKPRKKATIRQATLDKKGLKINKVTIIDFIKELHKPLKVKLLCECGSVIIKNYDEFIKRNIVSCGCRSKEIIRIAKEKEELRKSTIPVYSFKPPKDLTNKIFGKLTVLYWCGVNIDKSNNKHSLWYCQCSCGKYVIKSNNSFRIHNISCGCNYRSIRQKRAVILNNKRQDKIVKLINDGIIQKDLSVHNHRRLTATVRRQVFIKHGDRCLICGMQNSKAESLCIHHLKPHWAFPSLRYFVSNNIPLCRKCHTELHREVGVFNLSIMPQIEFINKHRDMVGVTYIQSRPFVWLRKNFVDPRHSFKRILFPAGT
jgi:hypothetical protein